MKLWDLFFLAMGGVIGSGWLMEPESQRGLGALSWASLLIGGLLMLITAVVMVELSIKAPMTGGLIFLPLRSSGPLLATVAAVGLWIFYAFNPASEAAAMVRGVDQWVSGPGEKNASGLVKSDGLGLTTHGIEVAAAFMVALVMFNLFGRRVFLFINNVLTAFKIIVPVGILVLLFIHLPASSGTWVTAAPSRPGQDVVSSVLSAVTTSGVIYAYLGFQGPLDFAGSVKRGGRICEATRLRLAVYGSLCGAILLYVLLQVAVIYSGNIRGAQDQNVSPYPALFHEILPHWPTWILYLDMVLSPAGAALVFTYVLTREVAALSRSHLTHRGLQRLSNSIIKIGRLPRLDVYWRILIIDLVISLCALWALGGNWGVLSSITSVLALVVYATPSVVLASMRRWDPVRFKRASWYPRGTEAIVFVVIAVIVFLGGWSTLWPSMAALAIGCCLLLFLPYIVTRPFLAPWLRFYDAEEHVSMLWEEPTGPMAQSAFILLGFLALVMGLSPLNQLSWQWRVLSAAGIAVVAGLVFRRLVILSARNLAENEPLLPPTAD
jgi:amino acid transporter